MLVHNVVLAAAICTKPKVEKSHVKCKYQYAINASAAISRAKDLLVKLIGLSHKKVIHDLMNFVDLLALTTEPMRPRQRFKRMHKMCKRVFL
ncbi:hypothetical protein AB835_11340 [Candidatus Endobugula sertula]|uniref:Uncharacterized protein n=1 Tax=Candidatus Endobugula sertula TaxID=62101 RepID=A0A1D2QMX9_9GAMM|nr:hypothetical protein AB835_11340 [Candidatus Endobugula sertula]